MTYEDKVYLWCVVVPLGGTMLALGLAWLFN